MKSNLQRNYFKAIHEIENIARLQFQHGIISKKEFNKIMFLIIDKIEIYMNNLEKKGVPEFNIVNYRTLDLFSVTNVLFCIG